MSTANVGSTVENNGSLMSLPVEIRNIILKELLVSKRRLGAAEEIKIADEDSDEDDNEDEDENNYDDVEVDENGQPVYFYGLEPSDYYACQKAVYAAMQPVFVEFFAKQARSELTSPIRSQVSPQILCCNRDLLREGEDMLYQNNTVEIRCQSISRHLLISLFGKTVCISGDPKDLPESEAYWFTSTGEENCRRQRYLESPHLLHQLFPNTRKFQRFHIVLEVRSTIMVDRNMFVVCRALRNLVEERDVVIELILPKRIIEKQYFGDLASRVLSATVILRCRSIDFLGFGSCSTKKVSKTITRGRKIKVRDTFIQWKRASLLFDDLPEDNGWSCFVDDYVNEHAWFESAALSYDRDPLREHRGTFASLNEYLLLRACTWVRIKFETQKWYLLRQAKQEGLGEEDEHVRSKIAAFLAKRNDLLTRIKSIMNPYMGEDYIFESEENYFQKRFYEFEHEGSCDEHQLWLRLWYENAYEEFKAARATSESVQPTENHSPSQKIAENA